MAKDRSEAQKSAEKRYNQKRLRSPSIPAIRLDEDQKVFTDRVFEKYGKGKKEAVLKGLELLEKSLDSD